jgi:ribokinase
VSGGPRSGPIVVVGAHAQGLVLNVAAVPVEGETVLASGYAEPPDGGKASNQAVAAARLGAPVALATIVGNDERGRRAREVFDEHAIDTRWCTEVDGPTDVGFIMLPPSKISAIAVAMDRSRDLDAAFVEQAATVITGASVVICQLEAPQEAARAAFAIAHEAGALTLLNPSPAAPLEPRLLEGTDVLVPNEHEAAALTGHRRPPAELADELAETLPVSAVVVTAGAAGAYFTTGGAVEHVPARTVEPVDTTGAGDAFVGAFAVRLRAGDSLGASVEFAVEAATRSVTRPGTMLAFATADELERRL